MTKNIKKTLALILSVIMIMSALPMTYSFANVSSTGLVHSPADGKTVITGYKGSESDLVIPSVLSKNTVVEIAQSAFINSTITSVVIPDTVETIGSSAFFRCANLQTVIIGSGVTKIDSAAFRYCTGITSVKYKGSETQWNSIEWGVNNDAVKNCEDIEFYYGIECSDGNHLATFVPEVPAGCTTDGNVAYWYCEVCEKAFSDEATTEEIADVVLPAKHILAKTQASAPNCAEEGNVEYWNCSVCGKNYEDEAATKELDKVTLDKNDSHSYPDNWTFNIETGKHEKVCANDATHILSEACADSDSDENCLCDACGVLVAHDYIVANCTTPATCSVCGDVNGDIDADNHSLTKTDANDFTCTANGNKEYWYCSLCEKYFKDAEATTEYAENEWVTLAKHDLKLVPPKAATCKDAGNIKHWYCKACNTAFLSSNGTNPTENVVVPATGNHTYDEGSVTTEPGCTTLGVKTYTCTLEGCGATRTEDIDATNHTFDEVVKAKAATCIAKGYEAHKQCTVCELYFAAAAEVTSTAGEELKSAFDTAINPDNHSFSKTFTVDVKATCEAAGSKSKHCTRTGCTAKTEATEIEKREHVLADTTQATAPNCTEAGAMNQECTNIEDEEYAACDYTTTRPIPATNHTFGTTKKAKAATCVAKGYEAHKQCTVCSKYFAADAEVTSTAGEESASAFDIEIDNNAHKFATTFTIDAKATCDAAGSKSKHCTRNCGAKTETTEIAKRDHVLADTTQATAPNCTDEGAMNQECTNVESEEYAACDYTTTRPIPANGHTEVDNFVQPATCTQPGKQGAKYCTTCLTFTTAEEEIPALGHDWEELEGHDPATCIKDGKNNLRCKREGCGVTNTEEVKASHTYPDEWHIAKTPDCTEDGVQRKLCTVCSDVASLIEESIPATGHTFGEVTPAVTATCVATGNDAYKQCGVCEKFFAADAATDSIEGKLEASAFDTAIDGTNHDFATTYTVDTKATCEAAGSKSKHCSRCDAKDDVTAISVRDHVLEDTTIAEDATCLEVGAMNQKCVNTETDEYAACNHTTTREIPAIGHTFGAVTVATVATCNEKGNHAYKQCTVCEKFFAADAATDSAECKEAATAFDIEIDAENHIGTTYNRDEDIVPGTCKAEKTWNEVTYCEGCDAKFGSVAKTGEKNPANHDGGTHRETEDIVAGTCNSEETWNEVIYCQGCDVELRTIPMTGEIDPDNHIADRDIVDEDIVYGTCITEKTWNEVTYCAGCDEELDSEAKSGEIDPDNHIADRDIVDEDIVYGTCIDVKTWNEVTYCAGCDEELDSEAKSGEIDPDNHVGETTVVSVNEVAGTCSSKATWTEITYCLDCDEIIGTEAKEGEFDPENHFGDPYLQGEDYVPGTCMTVETWNEVTRCGGCYGIINSIPKTGIKDPNNHDWSDVIIPNAGKDMVHYVQCQRAECGAVLYTPHASGHINVVEAATCQKEGLQYSFCYICKNDIYTVISKAEDHIDINGDKKCDWCNTSLQTSEPSQPENPGEPSAPQNPSANCKCGCHATGGRKLFFRFIIFFQKIFGFNKVCDCGTQHY